jgi:hypothetical protein
MFWQHKSLVLKREQGKTGKKKNVKLGRKDKIDVKKIISPANSFFYYITLKGTDYGNY